MSDEPIRPDRDDVALLLYDYFKHLTGLALLTLGGVLTISQGAVKVAPGILTPIVIAVALSGVISFHAQDQIIRSKLAGTALPRAANWWRIAATASLGVGLGLFLTAFLDVLR